MNFNNFSSDNYHNFKDVIHDLDEKKKGRLKRLLKIGAVAVVLIAILLIFVKYLMEYWQIREINPDFTSVFFTNIKAKVLTMIAAFMVSFIILCTNAFVLRKCAVLKYSKYNFLKKKWLYIILSAVLAFFASSISGGDLYIKLLTAINGESFNITDSLFSRDIGYYIFTRPFLTSIIDGVKGFILLQTIAIAVIYYFTFARQGYNNLKEIVLTQKGAVIHVLVNILIFFVLIMFSYRFTAEGLLYGSFSSDNLLGAGFVETNILANYYTIAPFIILLVIVLAIIFLYKSKYLAVLIVIAIVPVSSILASLAGVVVDSFVVSPNERNVQSQYIENNINATLEGFNLTDVKDVEYKIENDITIEDIKDNSTEIDNIRITDFNSSLTAYNQLQYFRKYYRFNDVDVVPYEIDGEMNAIFMSAREMNKENADEPAQSYANRMFRYTHGFGVVASPINKVTSEGQPEFSIRDIPPVSDEGLPQITQPRIYYGELTNDYVIVGGGNKELDYSEGLTDVEFTFDGNTGIEMTPLKRLLFAAYYRDYRMLFSSNINSQSKLLINRNIVERVKMAAPFLSYDSDPYIIIADDGTLKWIIDGYTTSSSYPYAQRYDGINYIRNSVKVIVDAYTGDMKFYVIDENDPIVMTYKNIYPELFTGGPLPEEVIDHITVPEYIFKLQRTVYQRYHVKDAGQFYDKADIWSVATEKYAESDIEVEPYFNVMRLSEDGNEELVLTSPFVLYGKYNMVGFLMTRTTADHYGEMVLYRMPKNTTVYGSMQIENRIDNDPEISREMTLWNSGGSTVIRGNLLVVPFKNSILYVEPVYITTQNSSSLPELKRIIVAYKDSIAMEATLEESLAKVINVEGAPSGEVSQDEIVTPESPIVTDTSDKIRNVIESYDKFREASKDNDWERMGDSLAELDKYIGQLR
ncbi:MAG: UPF0182 family protein [Ruminococcaceae bacterium]|nr:UPF0182 family protein [Oscillospiraceae bacterium]